GADAVACSARRKRSRRALHSVPTARALLRDLTEARLSPLSAAAGRAQLRRLYRETPDPRDDRTRHLSDPSAADAPVYQEVNAARNDAACDRKMEVQHDPERTASARPRDSDDASHPPRHCRLHDLAPGGHERRQRRREHDRPGDRPGPVGPGQMRRVQLRAMIAAGSLRVFLAVSLAAAGAWASAWALDPSATRIEFTTRTSQR